MPLEIFGRPGRIILEVESLDGSRIQVPLEEHETIVVNWEHGSYGELRVPFRGKMLERVLDAADEHAFRTGRQAI